MLSKNSNNIYLFFKKIVRMLTKIFLIIFKNILLGNF